MLQSVNALSQGRNFVKGLQGIDSLSVGRVWMGTMIVPGYGQAYNKEYWKIPVIYAGLGSMTYLALHSNRLQQDAWGNFQLQLSLGNTVEAAQFENSYRRYKNNRDLAYVGAALFYLGGALDAVYHYKTDKPIVPAKPTIYSTLIPGLGQVYNKEYWKVPIVYGGLAFCGYLINFNNIQYNRYRDAFNAVSQKQEDEFNGRYSTTTLKYFRDEYRRNRDYSILAFGVVYALNIIDAHVFAHLADYDISDDLSVRFEPTLFNTNSFASNFSPAVGFNLTLTLK